MKRDAFSSLSDLFCSFDDQREKKGSDIRPARVFDMPKRAGKTWTSNYPKSPAHFCDFWRSGKARKASTVVTPPPPPSARTVVSVLHHGVFRSFSLSRVMTLHNNLLSDEKHLVPNNNNNRTVMTFRKVTLFIQSLVEHVEVMAPVS